MMEDIKTEERTPEMPTEGANEPIASLAPRKGGKLVLPITALALDVACPIFLLVGLGFGQLGSFFVMFAALFILLAGIAPVGGATVGTIYLTLPNKRKAGIAMSVAAISLPVAAVIVAILLLSTGVAVITFM